MPAQAPNRPLTRAEATAWAEAQRRAGRRVVFTNGVFDLMHPGHVRYLQAARAEGDALIVAINSDPSVRGQQGRRPPDHPRRRAGRAAARACVRRCGDAVRRADAGRDHPRGAARRARQGRRLGARRHRRTGHRRGPRRTRRARSPRSRVVDLGDHPPRARPGASQLVEVSTWLRQPRRHRSRSRRCSCRPHGRPGSTSASTSSTVSPRRSRH